MFIETHMPVMSPPDSYVIDASVEAGYQKDLDLAIDRMRDKCREMLREWAGGTKFDIHFSITVATES